MMLTTALVCFVLSLSATPVGAAPLQEAAIELKIGCSEQPLSVEYTVSPNPTPNGERWVGVRTSSTTAVKSTVAIYYSSRTLAGHTRGSLQRSVIAGARAVSSPQPTTAFIPSSIWTRMWTFLPTAAGRAAAITARAPRLLRGIGW